MEFYTVLLAFGQMAIKKLVVLPANLVALPFFHKKATKKKKSQQFILSLYN
jgi:hypothetical protein